jgi:nitroimidazol reductase NimA-like FMN-containing flavoprotein (pyridoxamine 5'-phosphate oxidase superfamily)
MNQQRLASFATVGISGGPHVVPVFFTYQNGKVFVQTDRKSVKVRNLMRNLNVAVAVYSEEEAVIIRGKGRIIDSDEEFVKRTEEHVGKYGLKLDSQGRDSLSIPLFDREIRCVVEVSPEKVMFW